MARDRAEDGIVRHAWEVLTLPLSMRTNAPAPHPIQHSPVSALNFVPIKLRNIPIQRGV